MNDSDDEIVRKPGIITDECETMLNEAVDYIEERSPKQAKIMLKKFETIVGLLETFPEIGTKCQKGMRKFKLGKFRYNIFYKIKETEIEILGIWHTSRGTEFVEPQGE